MADEVLNTLCSAKKIERDSGVVLLHKFLTLDLTEARIDLETKILQLLRGFEDIPWETKHGCLLGAKEIILKVNLELEREIEFINHIKDLTRRLLTDIEVRVRLESGKCCRSFYSLLNFGQLVINCLSLLTRNKYWKNL